MTSDDAIEILANQMVVNPHVCDTLFRAYLPDKVVDTIAVRANQINDDYLREQHEGWWLD